MKKVLMILGAVFLVIIFIIIIIIGKALLLDIESEKWVDSAIPAIVTDWNEQEFINRASPELMATFKGTDLIRLFRKFRKVGKLIKYNGSEGESNISLTTEQGKVISAYYVAKVEFDTGPAEIQLTLIKRGDNWQIIRFYLSSDVFPEEFTK